MVTNSFPFYPLSLSSKPKMHSQPKMHSPWRERFYFILFYYILKRVNCVNCEIRPNRPNGPVGKPRTSTSTCPTKLGPILSHGPPVRTMAQTCPSRFKKLVLQAREACPASLRGLFSRSGWLPQQVCEACSTRKGGKTSLL